VGIAVEAFLRWLRTDVAIGSTRTDADGRYAIGYAPEAVRLVGSVPAEILVRASSVPGGTGSQAEARQRIRIGEDAVVDLDLGPVAGSEWDQLDDVLKPLLADQGESGQPLAPWELDDEEVAVLAEVTGRSPESLRLWATAARAVHDQWPDLPFDTSPEFVVTFGWLQAGLSLPLDNLLGRPTTICWCCSHSCAPVDSPPRSGSGCSGTAFGKAWLATAATRTGRRSSGP
jgi:hypothetical protein